jgi:genome maintenance protein MGM101
MADTNIETESIETLPAEKSRVRMVPDLVPVDLPLPELPATGATPPGGTSTLTLTDSQRLKLSEAIPDAELEILPSGEVYAPQVRYRQILTDAVGPGRWGLVECSEPAIKDNSVYQKWGLYINGVLVATAWGGHDYIPSNKRMSYVDSIESAKSNALVRCCKDLGIAWQCWDRKFTDQWKKDYAVEVWVTSTRTSSGYEKCWRKRDAEPLWNERPDNAHPSGRSSTSAGSHASGPVGGGGRSEGSRPSPSRKPSAPSITSEQASELREMCDATNTKAAALCAQFGVPDLESLNHEQYSAARNILEKRLKTEGGAE